eukprot:Protomagalhaensia_wolfi_Nauph_80__5494@NODE_601_length_2225_cov_11_403934_g450_i0_p1_GENE_NODE_601_length_2225_cov_11_403934_g450_i0NODE_601_length_2225_cov_11_403934_g450_i0_p1_ORF_typecomplete_len388_score40_82MGC24/PF05283_11/0_00012Podoplanin/PF05808_11/0_0068Alpha_GJ/PF03229_13/1_2Dicty_REP/PF05086_12/7_6_NODE_601_length_2225_cov_11_403934_g450_i01571320
MLCRLMQTVLTISLWLLAAPDDLSQTQEISDDSIFYDPLRPPFRNGWTIEDRDVPILCSKPDTENLMIKDWPLPPFQSETSGLPSCPTKRVIDSESKPNPDAVPICGAWRTVSPSDEDSDSDASEDVCESLCESRLYRCYFRPQLWIWYEWRAPTELMGKGSARNWNGPFDCVAEELLGKCAGPCRSMSKQTHGSPCVIQRDQCDPVHLAEVVVPPEPEPESTDPASSTETTDTTEGSTMSTTAEESRTTEMIQMTDGTTTATVVKESTTVAEEGGWSSGEIIGSAVVSAGGAAIGIGACCRCSGGTAQMAGAPGIKDFGAAIGGGADDVVRMAVERKERKEDRMGNKEAMEAELAARMTVAMTVSDQPSQLLSGKTALFSSAPQRQ